MITITEEEFKILSIYIKENYGIYLRREKQSLVEGRLASLLIQKGFQSYSEYIEYIMSDKSGEAASVLIERITTNHTFFMREQEHFIYFKEVVLPYLSQNTQDKDLRIWSAGCSTGEEPYTLAILMDEFFGKESILWDTKILATDISGKVLEEARKGVFREEKVNTLPVQWKINYFKQDKTGNYMISDKIKNEVIFRKFNLMEAAFPFKKRFHIIFCRNVMIYFDYDTKNKLVDKFYHCLENGGYLFVGHSESINREESGLKYMIPAVYRKV